MRSFFCSPWELPPAGLWSWGHVILLLLTLLTLGSALYASRAMREGTVRRVIRISTCFLWVAEVGKILFVLLVTGSRNPNDFVPLYYCSLVLYAGLFSSLSRGRMRAFGDCFLATGSVVGGAVFLLFPTSTLLQYPAWHVLSLHSFLLHGLMVYLGLLLLLRGVYRPVIRDLWMPAVTVGVSCVLALAFNACYNRAVGAPIANLMFISQNTPGTPLELVYRLTGPLFTPVMCLSQMLGPFLLVLFFYKAVQWTVWGFNQSKDM